MTPQELSRLNQDQIASYKQNIALLEAIKALAAESKSSRVMRALAYAEAMCQKTPANAAVSLMQTFE